MPDVAKSPWFPASTAPVGERVAVSHELDPNSKRIGGLFQTTGIYDGESWTCTAGFVCDDGFLRFDPTHWSPISIQKHEDENSSASKEGCR